MRVTARDLEQTFQSEGGKFESLVEGLIRSSARVCGIRSNDIHWDPRTHVKDGGRDIVVRTGNPRGEGQFIPARPSLWSLKSGDDGVDPNKLEKEILPQPKRDHPKVREALGRGDAFIWCAVHPIGHDGREAMEKAAGEIAAKLSFDPALIQFRWQDQLLAEVNRHPNLIPLHLPGVGSRWQGVQTFEEWARGEQFNQTWVDFGGRTELAEQVAVHLLSRGDDNVLHIAGLSGIGKSRTVFEACHRREELRGTFYLSRWDNMSVELERAVRDCDRLTLVIDETPLDQIDNVIRRFSQSGDRVRIVTIGPAGRQQVGAYPGIILVPEPEGERDVFAVIRGPGAGLPDEVIASIARRSGHDLRLALLLVRATLRSPEFHSVPVVNFDGVWQRVMTLFQPQLLNPATWRQRYEALCVTVDLGIDGNELREELQQLAGYFAITEGDLIECVNEAVNCGLGQRPGRFFEAVPHALAAGVFHALFTRRLRDNLQQFMGQLPPRLLRRFLERCHQCPAGVREEVAAFVGGAFLTWLAGEDVTVLTGREISRIFQAWAEFDPTRGLGWLRRAVARASAEQLLTLDGETDGSGGWRGRRQLVWLCQNLTCFAEHFADCEFILFRLALHETEPRIGNNSTAIWKCLFWPLFAQTEVPFQERFSLLLRRLTDASALEMPLVLDAIIEALTPRWVGMLEPPKVVGGRLTPPRWHPKTHEELLGLRREAAVQTLAALRQASEERLKAVRAALIRNLRVFRDLALVDETREVLLALGLPPDSRRELVNELEREIGFERRRDRQDGHRHATWLPQLERWRGQLAATDLATRVQDLTARGYDDVRMEAESNAPFDGLAAELIASPDAFRDSAAWFESDRAKSVAALAYSVGEQDVDNRLAGVVSGWLAGGRCRSVVAGYLNGVSSRNGGLPDDWVLELDARAVTDPEQVVMITASADISRRGFERIFTLLHRLPAPSSRFLRMFGYGKWQRQLEAADRHRILTTLLELAEESDPAAVGVGLQLHAFWSHRSTSPIEASLTESVSQLAALAPAFADRENGYYWRYALEGLVATQPQCVAELVVDILTRRNHPWQFDPENQRLLTTAASAAPGPVMGVIGTAILDPDRRVVFLVEVYRGLFDAIGIDVVRNWLTAHGGEPLRWLARHFSSPTVDAKGEVVIPPLTHWLFTDHAADVRAFESFLAGRHHGASVWMGDRSAAKRAEMDPFLRHPNPRVRAWAEFEVRSAEGEAEWHRQLDDEEGRW